MKAPHRTTLEAILAAPVLAVLLGAPVHAAGFQDAQKQIGQRLEGSLRELAQVRDRIAKEKIPLSKQLAELEDEVIALRGERDRLLKVRDSRTLDLSSLRKQVESLEEQEDFVDGRLDEFVREFESRLDVSELPHYVERTSAAKLAEKNANLDAEGRRAAQLGVVRAALARLGEQLGGQVFPGEALSPEGVLTPGRFVALGPSVLFASEDGRVVGFVENRLNAADPVVVGVNGRLGAGIQRVASSGRGDLPLDPTLGKALKTEKARESLRQHLEKGGVVGYVILGLGAAAIALAVFKCREILSFKIAPVEKIDVVLGELANGNQVAAAQQARSVEGVAGEMLSTGVEHAGEKRGLLEELLFEKILRVRPTLERFLPFLAITAAAAPLLGLLGTVTGMIKTFQLLTLFGTGDAKSLSAGISEALVTTELGLMVAIPTLILHGALTRMAKRKLGLLEQLSVAFVNGVAAIRHSAERAGSEA